MTNRFLFNVYVEAMYQREYASIQEAYARADRYADRSMDIVRWHKIWHKRARLMRRIASRFDKSL